jgi:hypothetical protein
LEQILKRVKNKKVLSFIFILGIVFFVSRYLFLAFRNSFSIGIDGYYYTLQVESYLTNGFLYFPTNTPLILYFLSLISYIIDNTPAGIKFVALLLLLLLAMGVYTIVLDFTRNYLLGFLSIFLIFLSGLHLYLAFEYISYLGGLTFLIWSLVFLIRLIDSQGNRITVGISFFCLSIIAIFSHRSIILIAFTGLICLVFSHLLLIYLKKEKKIYQIGFLLIFVLILFLPIIFSLEPNLDIFLVSKDIKMLPSFPSHFATLPEIIILFFVSPIVFFIIILDSENSLINGRKKTILVAFLVWTMTISLNPFISSENGFFSIGGRLRTVAFIQVAIFVPFLFNILINFHNKIISYLSYIILPLMLWSFLSPIPRGIQSDYLTARALLINGLTKKLEIVSEDSLIIADHGDQFVITAIAKVHSQQTFPQNKNNFFEIYWLLRNVPPTLVDKHAINIATDFNGNQTVLVKHNSEWEKRLNNKNITSQLTFSNPHLYFFLRNKMYMNTD